MKKIRPYVQDTKWYRPVALCNDSQPTLFDIEVEEVGPLAERFDRFKEEVLCRLDDIAEAVVDETQSDNVVPGPWS